MDRQTILEQISAGDWEIEDKETKFLQSLLISHHLEYLTRPRIEELVNYRVFKVRGQNIGFAITPKQELVAVHNNSGFHGLGRSLVTKAIELGGQKVFHFDGFLTGFYSSLGFIEDQNQRVEWDEVYAPKNWKYQPIDITNSSLSVYADEIRQGIIPEDVLLAARARYDAGKPDVITRIVKF